MKFLLLFLFFITAGILAGVGGVCLAQPEIPVVKSYANDFTSTLNVEELGNLNQRLKTYQDTTSNQIVMMMIATLDDYPLENYAIEAAEKNKIGTKEHDNGALLLIVKNDRKLRIEVGYGLEGVLPDALTSSIIRNVIVPHFKNDDYYGGVSAGLDAMIAAIAGEYKAEPGNSNNGKKAPGFSFIIFIIIAILSFFLRGRKGRRGGGFIFFPGGGFGGGSGGGFGGGGGGGFSGGGGSFGGGGSSGSW